jgi:hypothetical protein
MQPQAAIPMQTESRRMSERSEMNVVTFIATAIVVLCNTSSFICKGGLGFTAQCVWSTDDSAMFAFNDVKRRKATWNLVDSRTCSGSYSPYKTCNVTLENGCVIRGTYVFTAAGTMSPIYQTILLSAKELLVATCKSGKCCCCCC